MDNIKKIEKINSDRIIILKNIKDKLLNSNTDNLISENNIQINKAKEIIVSLTNEISNCHDIEEIKRLRRKVNYYINKIKKEMHNRGISEEKISTYQEATSYLRKGMSQYISYLKREPKLDDINNLNSNFNSLNDEDKTRLKKLLNNELRYNREVIKKQTSTQLNGEKDDLIDDFDEWVNKEFHITHKTDSIDNFDDWVKNEFNANEKSNFELPTSEKFEEEFRLSESTHQDRINLSDNDRNLIDEIKGYLKNDDNSRNIDLDSSLRYKMNQYMKHYGIIRTKQYGTSIGKNIVIFCNNIPKYIKNKHAIKLMKHDYHSSFIGNDLKSYIAYTEKSNSIGRSLGQVIYKSMLLDSENQCLNDHDRCMEWINKYGKTKKKALEKRI